MKPAPLAERIGSFCPGVAAQIRTSDALKRELNELGARCAFLMVHEQTLWSSITFSGTRQRLVYVFEGREAVEHAEELISVLPEHAFTIPHQLVADACVVEVDHRLGPSPRLELTIELLLLDEA